MTIHVFAGPSLSASPVLELDGARNERFDVAVATWWETTLQLHELAADRYAYFVQSMEDRFYGADTAERAAAATDPRVSAALSSIAEDEARARERLGIVGAHAGACRQQFLDHRVLERCQYIERCLRSDAQPLLHARVRTFTQQFAP